MQAALKAEISYLKSDVEDRSVEPMPAGAIGGIDDATLLQTPPESVKSS